MENSPGFLEETLKFGEVFFFPFIGVILPETVPVGGGSDGMLTSIQGHFSRLVFLYNINPGA